MKQKCPCIKRIMKIVDCKEKVQICPNYKIAVLLIKVFDEQNPPTKFKFSLKPSTYFVGYISNGIY